jgi:hypothetical protein
MKNISEIENEQRLKPWQRKVLIVIGAIAGGVATHMVMRWMERRKYKQASRKSESPGDAN